MSPHRTTRIAAILLAIPLVVAALSACTPGPAPEDVGEQPQKQRQSFDSFDDYQLALADCMREQGIEFADPTSDGIEVTADDAFMEAAEACQAELGAPPAQENGGAPSVSDEQRRTEQLELASCFREHGVDVADPAPGGVIEIPTDVPADVFDTCAPRGISGSTTGGGR